jgi:hypothetical protein
MNKVGFNRLESLVYETAYKQWSRAYDSEVMPRIRRSRAIAIANGTSQLDLIPIDIQKQQYFLDYKRNQGQSK